MSFFKNKKLYFILGLLIIAGSLLAGYKVYKSKEVIETIAYKEEAVSKGDIKVEYTVDGTIELPFKYMDFANEGEISEIFFKVGDTFKKGDAVAKQSDLDMAQTLKQAKLAYDKAKINYRDTVQKGQTSLETLETEKLNAEQQINKQKKTIYDAKQVIHKLESDIKAMELTPDEYSAIDIQNSKRDLESLTLNLETEQKALSLIERESKLLKVDKDSSVELSNINIEEAKMTYENAQTKLGKVNMYARENGKILTITKDVGESVAAINEGSGSTDSSFITYIATDDPYVVTMAIPEFDLISVSVGQKAEVLVEGFSETALIGTVTEISEIAKIDGNQVVTYAATVQLAEKPEGLKNGMNAVVSIISKEVKNVITISNKTVYFENGKQYVKIKDAEGNVQKTTIVTGFSDGTVAEVKEGLKGNETLVSKEQVKESSKEQVKAE